MNSGDDSPVKDDLFRKCMREMDNYLTETKGLWRDEVDRFSSSSVTYSSLVREALSAPAP